MQFLYAKKNWKEASPDAGEGMLCFPYEDVRMALLTTYLFWSMLVVYNFPKHRIVAERKAVQFNPLIIVLSSLCSNSRNFSPVSKINL